jgi:hypothetical protein
MKFFYPITPDRYAQLLTVLHHIYLLPGSIQAPSACGFNNLRLST